MDRPLGFLEDDAPEFLDIRHRRGCQPYAPSFFTPRKDSWYSFLIEAVSTPGPQRGWKD
jgi:hypothetical protein